MKFNNILHITDDYLYFKNKKNKEIIEYKLPDRTVYGGKISNTKKFIKSFEKLLNANHLNNSLFGDTIKIIVANNYKEADILFLKNIISSFNYRKIVVEKEIKYYKLKENIAYINIFDNYFNVTYLDEYKKIKNIYMETNSFKNTSDILKYIDYITDKKEVCLLGSGNILEEVFLNLEDKFNKKTYIFKNHDEYRRFFLMYLDDINDEVIDLAIYARGSKGQIVALKGLCEHIIVKKKVNDFYCSITQEQIDEIHSKGKLTPLEIVELWESYDLCVEGNKTTFSNNRCQYFNQNCHECLMETASHELEHDNIDFSTVNPASQSPALIKIKK